MVIGSVCEVGEAIPADAMPLDMPPPVQGWVWADDTGCPTDDADERARLINSGRPASPDPIDAAAAALRGVDRLMSLALRAMAEAGPTGGMPADRLISLTAGATGWDVRFLRRVTDTLAAMPAVWSAFDAGRLSWSQLRGIALAARRLSVADRGRLDAALADRIEATGEPDALVERAQDLAVRLDEQRQRDRDRAQERTAFLTLTPRLFGGVDINGHVDELTADVIERATDAAADPPTAEDRTGAVDDDGKPVPGSWGPPNTRAGQRAEALGRVCQSYLDSLADGGVDPARARTTAHIITDLTDLADSVDRPDGADRTSAADPADPADRTEGTDRPFPADRPSPADRTSPVDPAAPAAPAGHAGPGGMSPPPDDAEVRLDGVGGVTARLLWNLAGGRLPLSRAQVHALTCDAARVPGLTDGPVVIAIGDAHDPIPTAIRRAARVRDQGCRMPGCRAPARHTDLHHVIPRAHGGPTTLANLVSLCRRCHVMVHDHGWQLTLHPDATLTVRRGRWHLTSRPRLR